MASGLLVFQNPSSFQRYMKLILETPNRIKVTIFFIKPHRICLFSRHILLFIYLLHLQHILVLDWQHVQFIDVEQVLFQTNYFIWQIVLDMMLYVNKVKQIKRKPFLFSFSKSPINCFITLSLLFEWR